MRSPSPKVPCRRRFRSRSRRPAVAAVAPLLLVLVLLALACSSCASSHAATAPSLEVRSTGYGDIVTDVGGRSLYMYVDDSTDPPRSNCTGGCAADWPPALVAAGATVAGGVTGKVGTLTRADGAHQLTLGGNPLYTFAGDEEPGNTRGEGVGGVWFLVTPSGEPIPFVSPSFGQPFPVISTTLGTHTSSLGTVVTDAEGQTLYTYSRDHGGTSACTASWCVQDWPPLLVHGALSASKAITAPLGSISRDDGTRQVTLGGHPLYAFSGDLVAGDVRGEGIGGTWSAVAPDGRPVGEST